MKKAWIIIPIVIVVAAATVLGLFAAGIIGNKGGEPVAQAASAEVADTGYFGELPETTYFDIVTERDPSTAMDNFVVIRNNKGEKVALKSTRLDNGNYRITAREGFKKRSTYKIFLLAAEFADEKYAGLTSFVFTIDGEEVENVHVKDDVEDVKVAGTIVELVKVGEDYFYNVILPAAADERFKAGDVILAQKPAEEDTDPQLARMYEGDIEGYEYNGYAAYTVVRDSEVVDGREEVYCRLANLDEVVDELDIYKHVALDETNTKINEEAIRDALEQCAFYQAVVEAADEIYDEVMADLKSFKGSLPAVTVKDKPKVTCGVSWEIGTSYIDLKCTFTITFAPGLALVLMFDNAIYIDPIFSASCSFSTSGVDLELNAGLKVRTETVFSVKMDLSAVNDIPKSFNSFRDNLVKREKDFAGDPIGGDVPFVQWNVPVWIFVLEFEIGMEINFDIHAEIGFEYRYVTETTFGVTFVNGDFDFYKSFDSDSTASDLVMLGKVKADAGLYFRFNVSCLKIVGVGIKVSAGVYGELCGQLRIEWLTEDRDGNMIFGYYLTVGAYVSLKFHLKAGFSLPIIGFIGFKKDFTIKRWEFPLFEIGTPYLVRSADDQKIEIRGPNAKLEDINCTAYDIRSLKDCLNHPISVKEFNFEYVDDAADYIIYKPEDGLVLVQSSVGDEFTKQVRLRAKSNKEATCILTFHKDAVMPTCKEPEKMYDVADGGDLTFEVKRNQSDFIGLTGENISAANYTVSDTGAITISAAYLASLPMGDHVYVYSTNRGSIYLTVIVKNSTPIEVEKNSASFNKSGAANVTFKLKLSGNYVKSVSDLDKKFYYVDKSGTMVVYALGLMDKPVGKKTFTITSSNDTTVDVDINITDDRAPFLYQDSYPFAKNAEMRNDVPVKFEKYGYAVSKVDGNGIGSSDYTIADDKVLIKASFLSGKSAGDYNFTVKFQMGDREISKGFTVSVKDSATLLAYTSYATFDKADPADVGFTVVATGGIILSGNNITAQNYSVKGNDIKIKASYLAEQTVGEKKFTATCGSESVALTVKVENNVIPQLVETEDVKDGKLTLKYDKSKKGSLSFEMILGGNPINQVLSDTAPDLVYTTQLTEKETTKFLIPEEYLQSMKCGTYEYRIVTDVLNLLFTMYVSNNGLPTPTTQTSLSYLKGSNATMRVQFVSNDKDVKKIECFGSGLAENVGASSIGAEQFSWDSSTGTLTFTSGEFCYAESLAPGYYKLVVYFGDRTDEDETHWIPVNVGITVSDKAANWIPYWDNE